MLQTLVSASCDTNGGEQHKPEQADTTTVTPSSTHTCKFASMSWKLSSHCALGLPPCTHSSQPCYTQGLTAMPHHPHCAASGKMPAWPQGACTAPHPSTGATSMANCRAGLSKALQFTPCCPQTTTNQHNQAGKQNPTTGATQHGQLPCRVD